MSDEPQLGDTDGGASDDARIRDLATGFALGDLDEAGLRELHERLRAPGTGGAEAARVAWETLGTVVDLRAQLGTGFQDTVRMIVAEGGAGSADFERRLRERLRASRPKLQPVPEPKPPRARRHPILWIVLGSLPIAAVIAIFGMRWEFTAREAVAAVTAVEGAVSVDGAGIVVGERIDRRPLLIPGGARLELTWPEARAALRGPANAVAGPNGLTLTHGAARVESQGGFALGLPDRSEPVALQPGTRLAVEARDGISLLGVQSGSATIGRLRLAAGQAISGQGAPFAWTSTFRIDRSGTACTLTAGDGDIDLAATAWSLDARLRLLGADERWELTLAGAVAVSIVLRGDAAVIAVDGAERMRLALAGAPLLPRRLVISCAGGVLRGSVDEREWSVQTGAGIARVAWTAGGGELDVVAFHTGPAF